ncbi:hypothetical protein MKK88_05885 [Methylobacterium sp. E-005]|uniref:hypothetical protein n=1 Tax=Methylobacterium sp. E-005 TaxID=2836549 RepID=UPI001FBA2BCF|nr:hypothetical protein [Methylobacterium sp. E-005]MCJ2085525.1 hypothetical protein [Methylobacterium sp. E-005]
MSSHLAAIDLYLATAPLPVAVTFITLGMLTIGLGPFVPVWIAEHVAAARRGEA